MSARQYFDEAADALRRAMVAADLGAQAALLDQALRLNRLGLAEERRSLRSMAVNSVSDSKDEGTAQQTSGKFERGR